MAQSVLYALELSWMLKAPFEKEILGKHSLCALCGKDKKLTTEYTENTEKFGSPYYTKNH
jgi:hypothetical protein